MKTTILKVVSDHNNVIRIVFCKSVTVQVNDIFKVIIIIIFDSIENQLSAKIKPTS